MEKTALTLKEEELKKRRESKMEKLMLKFKKN